MSKSAIALAIECTENKKTGPMHATYASQASCPSDCPLRNEGCYAQYGPIGIFTRRLNEAAALHHVSALDVAQAEAEAIRDKLSGRLDLRLHVVGDCPTSEAASLVADAALRRLKRGRDAFTYTHAWRDVEHVAWSGVHVLASAETPLQVHEAQEKGWATALVTGPHPTDKLYKQDGLKILPCPEQTRGVSCVDCRLCLNTQKLRDKGITIGFAAHGARAKRVLQVLNEVA